MGRQVAAGFVLIQDAHRLLLIGRLAQLPSQARHAQDFTDMAAETGEHYPLADSEGPTMAGDQGADAGCIEVTDTRKVQDQAATATGQGPSHGNAQMANTASHAQRSDKVKNGGPAMLILFDFHRFTPSSSPV